MIKKLLSIACVAANLVSMADGMQKSKTGLRSLLSEDMLRALTQEQKNKYFVEAASSGKEGKGVFLQLLDAGAEIDAQSDEPLITALHGAAAQGDIEILKILIARGAKIDVPNVTYAQTALFSAVIMGHEKAVEVLLGAGACIDATNIIGHSPLHVACSVGKVSIVKLLLDWKANVHMRSIGEQDKDNTPLHTAAEAGHLAVVRVLLQNKVSPTPVNNDNVTPLMLAEQKGYAAVAKLLRDATKSTIGCAVCAKTASSEVKLSHCARCKIIIYCSKGCQTVDWKEHKRLCEAPIEK